MIDTKGKTFEEIVEEVVSDYRDKPLEERNKIVEYVCEEYVLRTGKKPDSYQLTLLADVILADDFKVPASNKMQTEEFPVLSHSQAKRRKRREFSAEGDTLDFLNHKKKNHLSTSTPDKYKN